MGIEHYCQKWKLSSPLKICETVTSHIYQVHYQEERAILKLLTPLGQKNESSAPAALEFLKGQGAVRLIDADPVANLLEYLPGRHLKDLVVSGHDKQATQLACSVLQILHRRSGPFPPGLLTMKENFRALFELVAHGNCDEIYFQGSEVAQQLLATEQEVRLLHGDIHHKNILESSDRGWVAIDPQGLIGERTYDSANLFFNPDDRPSLVETSDRIIATCRTLSKSLQLNPQRILDFAFAFGCLSSAWCLEDGINPARRLRITRLLQSLRARDF